MSEGLPMGNPLLWTDEVKLPDGTRQMKCKVCRELIGVPVRGFTFDAVARVVAADHLRGCFG